MSNSLSTINSKNSKPQVLPRTLVNPLEPPHATMRHNAGRMMRLAVPVIASRLLNAAIGFVCMLMVARLGNDALAASALINSVTLTINIIIWSMPMGTGVVIGHAYGAGRTAEVGDIARQCLWLGIFVGVPASLLLWNIAPLLVLLGQDRHLVDIAAQYFRAAAWGVVPSMWVVSLTQFAVSILQARLVILWSCMALPFAIFSTYVLLFGKYGMPALGVAGAGYVSSAVFWLMFIVELLWLGYGRRYRQYRLLQWRHWRDLLHFNHLRELLSFGWFTTVQMGAEFFALAAATIFIGWFGANALAAQQIIIQVNALALMVPFGIAQVSSVLISQALGAKRLLDVRHLAHTALLLGGAAGVVFIGVYCFFAQTLIGFYLDPALPANAEIVRLATVLLYIAGFALCFNCVRACSSGSLRGIYDTKASMLTSIFVSGMGSLVVGLILTFGLNLGLGVWGIGLGFVVGLCCAATILASRLHKLSHPEILAARLARRK
jgi:multidrug resistance protein, MATE family